MRILTRLTLLILFAGLPLLRLAGQCSCTNCPQPLPDNASNNFTINVSGATNPTLGVNGQGICEVTLHFSHDWIGDLTFMLVSPDNDTIILVGPQGFFGATQNTVWDISFLPCADPVLPDPGFNQYFSNADPWGFFGNYTGSYYPNTGCLEDFDGPVNGNWTLVVADGQNFHSGQLFDWSITFCDPSGTQCYSCSANAGNLLQPDVVDCQGDTTLKLNLPPTFGTGQSAPGMGYTYAYVVAGAGGIIRDYQQPKPNLVGYLPGTYTVCGLSYLTAHQDSFPAPGTSTLAALTTKLNAGSSGICGKITTNCVNVKINPPLPDSLRLDTICAQDSVLFFGEWFDSTGIFSKNVDSIGCTFKATLELTVIQPPSDTLRETLCAGSCSTAPGFSNACAAGTYVQNLQTTTGCDSLVVLILKINDVAADIAPNAGLPCPNETLTLDGSGSTAAGPGVNFLWTAANGGNFASPTDGPSALVDAPGTYFLEVCRDLDGTVCCKRDTTTVALLDTIPAAPQVIFFPTTVCFGKNITFATPSIPGTTIYQWTFPPGVSIISGQNTRAVTVSWQPTSGSQVCVSAENQCGTSAQFCTLVNTEVPPTISDIVGDTSVCQEELAVYHLPISSNATGHFWTVTPPASITAGQGSTLVTVNWGQSLGGQVCVRASGICDSSQRVCLTVKVTPPPPAPLLSGDTSLCAGIFGKYTATDVPGATGFVWTVPAGASIVSGQNTKSLVVDWGNLFAGNVCVAAVGVCGPSAQACLSVKINPTPTANAGPNGQVCGLSFGLAAELSLLGSTGEWQQVSGTGTASFSNLTASNSTVSVNQHGVYVFRWIEKNGLCRDISTTQISFFENPKTGLAAHDCDAVNENFTVSFTISGGQPPYSATGGSVSGNTFTSDLIPNAGNYAIAIADANGCTATTVVGSHNCQCATTAGTMNAMPISACEGDTVTALHLGDSILDPNDVGLFFFHDNPGAALGQVLAVSATGVFGWQPNFQFEKTYFISFAVGNDSAGFPEQLDPCFSVAQGQPVVFHQNPQANAGLDADTCGLQILLSAAAPGAGVGGEWSVENAPPGSNLIFSNIQNPNSTATANLPGSYLLAWTLDNAGCLDTARVRLDFFPSPQVVLVEKKCDVLNENYTVTLTLADGTQPYSVDGNALISNVFTSNSIPVAQPFSFQISDANGCTAATVAGTHNCQCATTAGTMNAMPISACEGDTVTALHLGDSTLDPNDIGLFFLHDNPGAALGQVLAVSATGVFGWQPNFQFEKTYFISFAVGNDSTGFPEQLDPCFSVAQGQPVVFHQNPQANAGLDVDTCGLQILLSAAAPGAGMSGEWSVENAPPGSNLTFSNFKNPNSTATANLPGSYLLAWTLDNAGCADTARVRLDFFPSPQVVLVEKKCDLLNENYTVTLTLADGTQPYSVDGNALISNVFTSNSIPIAQPFSFQISDANGCTAATVAGTHSCSCASAAGTMPTDTLTACVGSEITVAAPPDAVLDGNDAGVFYLHTGAGNALGTVLAQNASGIFSFLPGMVAGQVYRVSYTVGNGSGAQQGPADPCFSVAVGQPLVFFEKLVANAGLDRDTCGLMRLLGATPGPGGTWSLVSAPLGSGLIFGDPNDPNSAVFVTLAGQFEVAWTVGQGVCASSDTVRIGFYFAPQAGVIDRICDDLAENFTLVVPLSGGLAPYFFNGQQLPTDTFFSPTLPNFSIFYFEIFDKNGCALSAEVSHACDCISQPGTMNLQPLTVCGGDSVTVSMSSNPALDANDAGIFVLHDAPTASLGNVLATSTTGVFSYQPNLVFGTTYFVSFVVGNDSTGFPSLADRCFGIAPGQPIVFLKKPAPQVGADTAVCGQTIDLQVFNSTVQGIWKTLAGPGNTVFSNQISTSTSVSVNTPGTYVFEWSEVVAGSSCRGADTLTVTFRDLPTTGQTTLLCDPTNQNYTVSFPISGGAMPYSVAGGSVTGGVFTSDPIPSGQTYSFQILDAAGCGTAQETGSFDCLCSNNPGSLLLQALLRACADDPLEATHAGNQTLGPNDVGVFILHDGSATSLGQVLDFNTSGSFGFLPGMVFGDTYYICYAVGLGLGGFPDTTDVCTRLTEGQPVAWSEPAMVTVIPSATVCNGSAGATSLNFSDLITSGDASGTWTGPAGVGVGTLPLLDFAGVAPGVYDFAYTTAAAVLPCENQTVTVKITVEDCSCPPLQIAPAGSLCGAGGSLDLKTLEANAGPGVWAITQTPPGNNPAVLNGSIFTVNNSDSGDYEITFSLAPAPPAGCPAVFSEILKIEKPAQAGQPGAAREVCEGADSIFILKNLLTGGDAGGVWTEISAKPSVGGAFDAAAGRFRTQGQVAGAYRFAYTVAGNSPCPDATAMVEVLVHATPKADAGIDQTLDCQQSTAVLGGPGTSAGPGFGYAWSANGNPIAGATAATFETIAPGIFTLEVTDLARGCLVSDAVEVFQKNDLPQATGIRVVAPVCYGDEAGSIAVEGVSGGTGPYVFSLNGGAFGSSGEFQNLAAGQYTLTVEDSKGCSRTSAVIEIGQPEELLVELGVDILTIFGDSTLLEGKISVSEAAIDTFIWSPLRNPLDAGKPTQTVFPTHTERFELTVIDTNGCRASDEVVVRVEKKRRVYVPNAFEPGSDENSILMVFGGPDVEEIEFFEIYDRWGERMFGAYNFQPNDPTKGWDGSFRGKKLTPGVYVFQVKIKFRDGETEVLEGDITLKR